jgi:hypothetical protein
MEAPLESLSGEIVLNRQGELVADGTPELWGYCGRVDLRAAVTRLGPPPPGLSYAVDLEIFVETGSVGVLLTGDGLDDFLGREQLVDATPQLRRITVSTTAPGVPVGWLLVRNTAKGHESRVHVVSAVLRFAS